MIASDIPRLDLMAKMGVNAEIFKSGDVNELESRILTLSSDPQKMAMYANGSKSIREKDFSIERRVRLTEKAYEDLFN